MKNSSYTGKEIDMRVDLKKLQKGRINMDMEKMPRNIQDMSGDDYMILEGLLGGMCPRGENGCNGDTNGGTRPGDNSHSGRCPHPHFPENIHLAMVYSPYQEFDNLYSPEDGLEAGTVFIKLDKPFDGRTISGGKRR